MLRTAIGRLEREKEMGSTINWIDERSPLKKEKDYIDSSNTTNGWKTIFNRDNFFVFISNFNDKHLYKVNFMNIENIKIKNDYIKNIQ